MATNLPFSSLSSPSTPFLTKLAAFQGLSDPLLSPNFRIPETLFLTGSMTRPTFMHRSEYGFVAAVQTE